MTFVEYLFKLKDIAVAPSIHKHVKYEICHFEKPRTWTSFREKKRRNHPMQTTL